MSSLEPQRLPSDPASGRQLGPFPQPGYYPGFSTLSQQGYWDETTRRVVLERVEKVPPVVFLTPDQERCLEAVFARIIPQDDRSADRQIPIINSVDARLQANRIDGYQFESMPPDREAYQLGVEAINGLAQALHKNLFANLEPLQQDEVLKAIHDGRTEAGGEIWQRLPSQHFWTMLVQDAIEAYYAHPWAWDEVGFGGPAYPRAYMRLERGLPEPWESDEKRYEWKAPEWSLSDVYEPLGKASEHGGLGGAGGTH